MPEGIRFDAAAARGLEAAYQTTDVIFQRVRVVEALALTPGSHVLDIGSGPGLLLEALAKTVGSSGRAAGVDQVHESHNALLSCPGGVRKTSGRSAADRRFWCRDVPERPSEQRCLPNGRSTPLSVCYS